MSQNNNGGKKNEKFLIDLEDDDDDFDFPSDGEIEISEDQRIMDEIILKERERDLKVAEKLRRSQTQENTLINSGEKKAKSRVTDRTDVRLLSAGGVIDENTIFIPKKLAECIANSQPPKSAPRVDLQLAKAATVPKNSDETSSNMLPSYDHHPDISSGQMDFIQTPIDVSGIIKCLSCDLHLKEYKKL